MSRPLKYVESGRFSSIEDAVRHAQRNGWFIVASTKQRLHPGWVMSWQTRMFIRAVETGDLLRAMPNPQHPQQKEVC